jgi:ubiquinone/menaquinone biosynthesis C-methylase UbiE
MVDRMSNSYRKFAEYYDILTENVDYKSRMDEINSLFQKYSDNTDEKILLDLACGTGSMSEEAEKLGYDVIGVDCSEEMLFEAVNKKYEKALDIQYVKQDMRKLDLYGGVDITICILDSLNHLSGFEDVKKVFERVFMFTNEGGLFIFDMNTPYKHRNVLADNAFIFETEDVFVAWENEFSEKDCKVDITLNFFEKTHNNYKRYTENFSELAYEKEDIIKACEEVGFKLMESIPKYEQESDEQPERIVYVLKKEKI